MRVKIMVEKSCHCRWTEQCNNYFKFIGHQNGVV